MNGRKEERIKERRNLFLKPFYLQFNVNLQYPREYAHSPERLHPHMKLPIVPYGLRLER